MSTASREKKFGVAQDEIVTLNRQNIENRKQLDESTTLVKELTEKIGVGKEEPLGGEERYDPQENEVSTERKDKLWELLGEMDDEEMAEVIQESTYQSAATAFTEIGFNTIQMIKRLTRPELQASEIPLLVKNTMMRIVDRIGIGTEESGTNKMMPTDWHKIQVSIDLEGRLKKIQWPFAAEFTPSRAMAEYFLKKMKMGKWAILARSFTPCSMNHHGAPISRTIAKTTIPMLGCSLILGRIMGPWARRFNRIHKFKSWSRIC